MRGEGWYHYPQRALRAAETPDGRLSKRLYIHFPVLCEPHYISREKNSGKVATINFIPNRSSLRFSAFLANGPRSLSRVKTGTHSPSPTGSHTAAHTPKHGRFGYGWYHYPRSVLHVHEPPRAGCQNGVLCRFWPWSDVLQKNAESLRNSDALMCVAVPRRRGPAGLRDPLIPPCFYIHTFPGSL